MKYGVRAVLPAEDVEGFRVSSWQCFAEMDRALRRYGPWPRGELGRWELAWAEYILATDSWLVAFRCFPLDGHAHTYGAPCPVPGCRWPAQ